MRTALALLISCSLLAAQNDATETAPTKVAEKRSTDRVIHELKLSGSYMDLPAAGLDITQLMSGDVGGQPKAFYDLIRDLHALDGGALLVDLSNPSLGLNGAQLTELTRTFDQLRQSGISTTAYLENASMAHYRVALLCDKVVQADMGMLDFHAPSMGAMFFKGVMDLLGVEMQITRCGDFKGAVEPFMRESMSAHLKEHYKTMLGTMNDHVVSTVSKRRSLSPETVRELQARRLLTATAALEAKLIDAVAPWRGARLVMATGDDATFKPVSKPKKAKSISLMSILSAGRKKSKLKLAEDSIVVLHLSGAIQDGAKASPGAIVSGPTVELIRSLAKEKKVKGVVVRVNSPGGSASASEAILLALRELAETRPVAVSMGEMAASGGYYVSMIGCKVLAEAETITGSIGVFGMRPNVKELADALGVHQEVVALDEGAANMNNVFAPLAPDQLARVQTMVDGVYVRFQDRILDVRPMTRDALLKVAGGRVWSGAQAKELGLVDAIGGLSQAIALVEEKAGKDHAIAHLPKPDDNPLGALGSLLGAQLRSRQDRLELLARAGFKLDGALRMLLDGLNNPGATRAWMMLPAELKIR